MSTQRTIISENLRQIVQKLEDNLKTACEQLTGDLSINEDVDFNQERFWINFISATKLISHEATKLCLAFDSVETLSDMDCQCLVEKIESNCLALLTIFFQLPKTRGKTFRKEIHSYTLDILQKMKNLCSAVVNQSKRLQNVGEVWSHCEKVDSIPKDNREAVLRICQEQHDVVQDASEELMMAIEDDQGNVESNLHLGDSENFEIPSWRESDRNVLFPASGLIKAAKACIRKTQIAIDERADGNSESCINELDLIADIVKQSSSMVDDFVLSLYPPMNHSSVRQQASLVRDNSKELLSTVKNCHFFISTDEVWLQFLSKAVDHNWVRINDLVLTD